MSGQDFANAGQINRHTEGRTDGRRVSENNMTKGSFGHIKIQFTVVLLHLVQINLNLPFREGYKSRKIQFQAYFQYFTLK